MLVVRRALATGMNTARVATRIHDERSYTSCGAVGSSLLFQPSTRLKDWLEAPIVQMSVLPNERPELA